MVSSMLSITRPSSRSPQAQDGFGFAVNRRQILMLINIADPPDNIP
jgi:hypothetical protein